jgi:hypothetical protein
MTHITLLTAADSNYMEAMSNTVMITTLQPML